MNENTASASPPEAQPQSQPQTQSVQNDAVFTEMVNGFINLANRANKGINASAVDIAFLFGAARYGVFAARTVRKQTDNEVIFRDLVDRYASMVRQHLNDTTLR